MAWSGYMFFDEQLLILRIYVLISIVSASRITDRTAVLNGKVELVCYQPVCNETVTWKSEKGAITGRLLEVSECLTCTSICASAEKYRATRNETSSSLFVNLNEEGQHQLFCFLGDTKQETYNLTVIEKPDISPPNCSITPKTSHEGRNTKLTFTCESYVPHELPYLLSLFGIRGNISKRGKSDLNIVNYVDGENFTDSLNVVCELRLSVEDKAESCSFPHSTTVNYTSDVTDAVFDCHVDPGHAVTWRLLDPEGREEDITVRSWISNGGRSLLIKNITKQDLGKVAECRSNGSVGFGVIDDIGSSGNELDYSGGTGTNVGHRDRLVYVTLTYVFGGALLITLLIAISHWRCGVCAHPMKWYAQFKPNSKPKTSPMNQLSGSTGPKVSGGGSNSRSPGRDVLTTESNLNSGNQNNSALNHPRDPTPQMKATLSSVADASSSGHPDQPVVDTNQHTYFCVERTTPPPSLPDLSTSGSVTIYQDPDYEESHGERLRDSAGYDVVDASKKKMNNNFDMEDYAEVGGAYDMTSNPAIAPRISKGWTGKGVVMSSDPAVLYGKVNK